MGLSNLLEKQPASYEKKKAYKFHKLLGTGTFGEVKQATWDRSNAHSSSAFKQHEKPGDPQTIEVAIKCIPKKLVKSKPKVVYDEMEVLKDLDNPHILRILDWFESKDKYYLVFELLAGGELFERIVTQKCFSEHDAASAVRGLLEGVDYLHRKGICHRDLKPENLLLRDSDNEHLGNIVIADFGVAHHLEHDAEMMKTLVGSPGYSAPELFTENSYLGPPADIYSIGVITYALISGRNPWGKSQDNVKVVKAQTSGKIDFSDKGWKEVSEEAKQFIEACLKVDPKKRMTSDEALNHPWLVNDQARTNHDLGEDVRSGLSHHTQQSSYNPAQGGGRKLSPGEQELSSPDDSRNSSVNDSGQEEVGKLSEKVSAVEI